MLMRDFTYFTYRELLGSIKEQGFEFQTIAEFLTKSNDRAMILRHDVDSWPSNALKMAKIENEVGIKATYYFRISPLSFKKKIINSIKEFGHEIGYHYEDLSSNNGDYSKAIQSFEQNLHMLQELYPIKTIAMHGKPLSKWNNLDLWKKYNFRHFDIIGESYLSFDFNNMLYLTDTGNCWDGYQSSVRDTVKSRFRFNIHTSFDLIDHLRKNLLPPKIMLNIHPARWNDNIFQWIIRYYVLTLPKHKLKQWIKKKRDL